jgi:hypothetical protein
MKKILILCTLLMVGCKKETLLPNLCGKVTELVQWNGKKYIHLSPYGKDEISVEVSDFKGIAVGQNYCTEVDFSKY